MGFIVDSKRSETLLSCAFSLFETLKNEGLPESSSLFSYNGDRRLIKYLNDLWSHLLSIQTVF